MSGYRGGSKCLRCLCGLPDNHSMSVTLIPFPECVVRSSGRRRLRKYNIGFLVRFCLVTCMQDPV